MSKLTDSVREAITPILTSMGVELVDIEFEKKYGQDNLTIFIYTQGGVSLDDCERVHMAIDPILDELDPTNGQPYVLNVSSPGLDRPFKTQRDFERNYGTEVEVKLYAPLMGKKIYSGVLISRDNNATVIDTEKGELKIENNRIALVRPLFKFS